MSEEKNGWDKIAEQENRSVKKLGDQEKLKIAAETTSNVSWVIYVVAIAIILAVVAIIFGIAV